MGKGKKKERKISPRFTAFAAGHAFNNQIRDKNQSLSKLTLKFCKTTLPLALHLTPIMKKQKRKGNNLLKQMSHPARPNSSDPFMKKPCVYLYPLIWRNSFFRPRKKEQLKTKKKCETMRCTRIKSQVSIVKILGANKNSNRCKK